MTETSFFRILLGEILAPNRSLREATRRQVERLGGASLRDWKQRPPARA